MPVSRARRVLRFFLKKGDATGSIGGNGIVFFDLLQIAHVVKREHGRIFPRQKLPKPSNFSLNKLSPADDDKVIIHVLVLRTKWMSPIAPSLLVSSVEPSLTMVKFSLGLVAR